MYALARDKHRGIGGTRPDSAVDEAVAEAILHRLARAQVMQFSQHRARGELNTSVRNESFPACRIVRRGRQLGSPPTAQVSGGRC